MGVVTVNLDEMMNPEELEDDKREIDEAG